VSLLKGSGFDDGTKGILQLKAKSPKNVWDPRLGCSLHHRGHSICQSSEGDTVGQWLSIVGFLASFELELQQNLITAMKKKSNDDSIDA